MTNERILKLVYLALFTAIIFLLDILNLGFIILPFLPIAGITTIHIPVIIGSYSLGTKGGAILGFFFGLYSLIHCFNTPDATAAIILGTNTGFGIYNVFLIIMVIFLPRILVGVFSALVYKAFSHIDKSRVLAMGVSAFIGSITNTILYLGGLYLFAFKQISGGLTHGALFKALLGIVAVNGVSEAVAAVIVCTAVGKAIYAFQKRRTA